MRCKLLQKRTTGKITECSKHLRNIVIEKDNFSELNRCNRCIFQISLKYIKLVIPKIHFILLLCSFNFYFKITCPPPPQTKLPPPPPHNTPPPPPKLKISDPPPAYIFTSPLQAGGGHPLVPESFHRRFLS